jgi:hypothetical protein
MIGDFSDRQARSIIVAAEAQGFEREPDRYILWYDAELHEDARAAAEFLESSSADALAAALEASDPIDPASAAARIVHGGKINFAQMNDVTRVAVARGLVVSDTDLPLLRWQIEAERAQAAVAYLWEIDPDELKRVIGDAALLAPIPDTARWPCRCHPSCDVDYY